MSMPSNPPNWGTRSVQLHLPSRTSTVDWQTNPQLGLAMVVVALGLAILTIPVECSAAGALRLPATIFSVALVVPTLLQLQHAPKSAFHALNIAAASPVYWLLLDMIQGAYPLLRISQADVINSFVCIALFTGGVWIGGMLPPGRIPSRLRAGLSVQLTPRQLTTLIIIAFSLAFLKFAVPAKFDLYAMVGAFNGGRWASPWGRGAMGGWDAFLDHFAYFGYILPVLVTLLARQLGWLHSRTLVALSLTLIIAAFMAVGGGRRIIGVMVGSALTVWLLSNPRVRLRSLITIGLCAFALLFVMQVILTYRNVGIAKAFGGDFNERMTERNYLHVDDNFLRLTQLTQIVPEKHPYVTWQWPLWIAVRPIPRIFWPGKPVDPGFNLPRYLGVKGVSYSSSIIGELYMAFGFLGCATGGVFIGWLAISLVRTFELYSKSGGLIVYGIGVLALFAGTRSGIDLVLMSYGIVGWFLVIAIYQNFFGSLSVHER
ncbi:O-antigen polymerase [Allorhodopirellula heiligendammensis]|uniref:Uncharacterized protein n=1 Tax=Allorhodopirellula heiligendammensis TaxID=2714739 RepID=A0A5C6BYS3_9BACT|nr:O-antigen polymerase [Allorhodopirellula heiligendammensis]TWU16992.1 hypothetical protein Poly21_42010 [Allorhodopirellula heiligendammensis]